MARPDKLTPEAHDAIIKALAIGCTRKDSAESAGVWYTTFLDWIKRGQEQTRGKFYKFYHDVAKAEAEARSKYTATIAKAAADGDWRAAETFLKRRDPENWGDKSKLEITQIDIDGEIERELARVAARRQTKDAGDTESANSIGENNTA